VVDGAVHGVERRRVRGVSEVPGGDGVVGEDVGVAGDGHGRDERGRVQWHLHGLPDELHISLESGGVVARGVGGEVGDGLQHGGRVAVSALGA
jgi:hypothetical protein